MADFPTLRIERAHNTDIPALNELLAGLFAIESDFFADRGKQSRGLELLLAQPPDRAIVMVARSHDDKVVAMASAQLVVSTAEGAPSAWIEDVIVVPARRRQGVAGLLLGELLKWAQAHGATRAQLLADNANTPALEFYDHLGWQPMQLSAWRRSLHR
jgi:GNAT superfamily N-acetyltransferase